MSRNGGATFDFCVELVQKLRLLCRQMSSVCQLHRCAFADRGIELAKWIVVVELSWLIGSAFQGLGVTATI